MYLEVARITDPSSVAAVSVPALVRLMRARAPKLATRLISGSAKPTLEDVSGVLRTVAPSDEAAAFLEDLHFIVRVTTSDSAEDLLLDQGVALEGTTLGDALAKVAVDDRTVFDSLADHATVLAASKGSTFTTFRPRVLATFELSPTQGESLKRECSSFFESLGQGSHCDVRPYAEDDETGFLIDHAGARRTERLINEHDEPEVRQVRPSRHDVLLLHRGTGRLRILARSEKERVFYAEAVGDLVGKGKHGFEPDEAYVLDAIASPNYQDVLRDLVDDEIERVALRELKFVREDDYSTRQLLSSGDVLGSIQANGVDLGSAMIQQATFAIIPRLRKRRRCFRVTVWKGNKMKHDAPWSDQAVQSVLERLQLRRTAR
jgi:hypothetical protein